MIRVSIHAPARGAISPALPDRHGLTFQSTPPRGGRWPLQNSLLRGIFSGPFARTYSIRLLIHPSSRP